MNNFFTKIGKIFSKKVVIVTVVTLVVITTGIVTYQVIKKSSESSNGDSTSSNASTEGNEEDLTPGQPYLSMKIVDYPSAIDNMCQKVTFTFEAENVGDTTLKYGDFENNYYFGITSDDAVSSFEGSPLIGSFDTTNQETDYAGLMPYTKIISDFGEILPGEKKTITYNSINYIINGQHEYVWINTFNNIINGNFSYNIEFGKLSEKGYFYSTEISKSSAVNISTNLYDANGGWRYCEDEVITDMSIDFYE